MNDKANGAAAPDTSAEAAAAAAAAPGAPSPEQIAEAVKGHQRVASAVATIGFITNQINQMLNVVCQGNTRLCLAITNELHLYYSEAVRRSVDVRVNQPNQPGQDNDPAKAGEQAPQADAEKTA